MNIKARIWLAAGSLMFATVAQAGIVSSTSKDKHCGATSPDCALQTLLDAWMVVPGTAPDVNAGQYSPDEVWAIDGTTVSLNNLVFELAGNATSNTFGIYDPVTGTRLQLFDGAAASGARGTLEYLGAGGFRFTPAWLPLSPTQANFSSNLFGYYLSGRGGTFYSEQSRNGGGDYMVTYRGNDQLATFPHGSGPAPWRVDEYLLGWEDIDLARGDKDYNDMLVLVQSVNPVNPVPAPGTAALLGLGLLGMGRARRHRSP